MWLQLVTLVTAVDKVGTCRLSVVWSTYLILLDFFTSIGLVLFNFMKEICYLDTA